MFSRLIPLEGVRNLRDFGGYETESGARIRTGVLFRSGHYADATQGDIETVAGLGITLQVDLRRPDERERMVAKWPNGRVRVITNDGGRETEAPHQRFLQRVEASAEKADNWMNEYYEAAPFKAHHQAMFRDWFAALETTDGAALVNCAAGKDRTGILCALTHHILGVSRGDMIADYELTNVAVDVDERLGEARDYFNNMLGKTYDADVYRPFMGVRARYLETALGAIEAQAGSIDAYLQSSLGVDNSRREALRARLLTG